MARINEKPFQTISEAASLLGVNPSTIWRWIKAGRLPAYRAGPKTIRIKTDDLLAVLQPAQGDAPEALSQEEPTLGAQAGIEWLSEQEMIQGLRAMQQARDLREAIRMRRQGEPLPSSWQLIREAREDRSTHL